MVGDAVLRIGELSKRSGVSPELLRAWERRYGLLQPTRTSSGLRLYSAEDVERVQLMRRHLADGLPGGQHDLGLMAFGLALRARGWRIVYLGADTPVETIEETVDRLEPSLVVLTAVRAERVRPVVPALRALARGRRVAIGGAAV